MRRVGIIMVNYKEYAQRFLVSCVESLRTQTLPSHEWRLYVVDNASTPASRESIASIAPEAHILTRPDGNYSAANNAGIRQAKADGCTHYVIANMDTVFTGHWLETLIEGVDADPRVGIAQSKILLWKGGPTTLLNSAGNLLHFLGFGFTRGYGEEDRGQYDSDRTIGGYASGCAMAIKTEVIERIGGYDEEYYMYHDDLEICWRARLAGYAIAFVPNSVVYHKYEFSRSIRMAYYMERNRYLTLLSLYRIPTLVVLTPALIFMEAGMMVYSLVHGMVGARLKIYGYFLRPRTWRYLRAVRRRVRTYRRFPDSAATQSFVGSITYQEVDNPLLRFIGNPLLSLYWACARRLIRW